ncbi:hypothetical protein OC835_001002 [Tilletia horrida]|nr:hypothetical protein OC835_001002 [Tilletia horrida]
MSSSSRSTASASSQSRSSTPSPAAASASRRKRNGPSRTWSRVAASCLALSTLLLAAISPATASSASSSSLYFADAASELAARHRHLNHNQARALAASQNSQPSRTPPQFARRGMPMGASSFPPQLKKRQSTLNGNFASSGFDYVNDKVRGVNLGNWLVLEPWMDNNASRVLNANAVNAPGAHTVIDEYTMGTYIDHDFLTQFFTEHFSSWITEDDFRQIADAGLNHVRIPIGHWAFADCIEAGAPYLPLNRFDKLKEGVAWAQKYNLKVWIDLHGTPGSQNGYPGSGRAGVAHWPVNATYYDLTQKAFNYLVAEFTQPQYKGTVTGIQPVNEPIGAYQKNVQTLINDYYPWSWDALSYPDGANQAPSSAMLVTHDAWQGLAYWQNFYNQTQSKRVIMDAHPYFVYGPQEVNATDSFRLNEVCEYGNKISQSQGYHPTVAGEWSIGAPNGDNYPALRDLPRTDQVIFPYGNKFPFSQQYLQFLSVNFRTQQQVFEQGSGWMFWNWKHLAFADQSYQTGIKYGWLPSNARELDQQPFGSLCQDGAFVMSAAGLGTSSNAAVPRAGAGGAALLVVGGGSVLAMALSAFFL